ncbi:uncharacterized protein LOC100882834 [Megachile rotundata]|uniref:uncharacterized protein LOC100882834 n=1 Tax=Megachile rotundata TaxID=143995 RepID=UPI003FD2BA0E
MTFPQADQVELIALAELAGISAIPGVYRIILELLTLQVSPEDIYILLKQICPQSAEKQTSSNAEDVVETSTTT